MLSLHTPRAFRKPHSSDEPSMQSSWILPVPKQRSGRACEAVVVDRQDDRRAVTAGLSHGGGRQERKDIVKVHDVGRVSRARTSRMRRAPAGL